MATRNDLKKQKEKTSQALIQAALQLCANEGYASLSLRSVARKAGIAPTSFYRHFREIDEMGVEMAAQAKTVLEEWLARARKKMTFPPVKKSSDPALSLKSIECITRPFAETFIDCLKKNQQLLHLFFQERTGSSEAMRTAISEACHQLIDLLAEDIKQLTQAVKIDFSENRLIADAMLSIVSHSGMEMLVQPDAKPGDATGRATRKLNLLLLGALTMEYGMGNTSQGDPHE